MKIYNFKLRYLLICFLSFFLGYLSNFNEVSFLSVGQSRYPANDDENVISYELLDCPTAREYRLLRKEINFVGKPKGQRCNNKSDKSKFAKLIKYLKTIRVPASRSLAWRS